MECIPPGHFTNATLHQWCTGIDNLLHGTEQCILGSQNIFDFATTCCTEEKILEGYFCADMDCKWYPPSACCHGTTTLFFGFLKHMTLSNISHGGLTFISLIILLWMFIGVGLSADLFMQAVEVITSQEKKVFSEVSGEMVSVPIWNATVANISLMAIGSSAPEILLSVFELFSNQFFSGQLGPFTIVGSASFNLFFITGICIVAIPDGQIRRIREIPVYITTLMFSLFAYIWIVIVIEFHTPAIVDPAEAIVTLLFFPAFIILSYLADVGILSKIMHIFVFQFMIERPNVH